MSQCELSNEQAPAVGPNYRSTVIWATNHAQCLMTPAWSGMLHYHILPWSRHYTADMLCGRYGRGRYRLWPISSFPVLSVGIVCFLPATSELWRFLLVTYMYLRQGWRKCRTTTQISVQNFSAVRCAVLEFVACTRYDASRLFSRSSQNMRLNYTLWIYIA